MNEEEMCHGENVTDLICSFLFRDEDEPEMIPDETAVKPEGWLDDEPELIPSTEAEKPSDW